jgi:8-oxo-dGTP pyrophosphatase MutT (NUDIX family)
LPSPFVLAIEKKLTGREPSQSQLRLASVAVILRDSSDPAILMIKRAERWEDPWSGHIAFPGGKWQEGDRIVKEIAVREAREEIGIDLEKSAKFLGYFGKFRTHTLSMDVIPSVFLLESDVAEVNLNAEVSSYRWVDLKVLADPLSQSVQVVKRVETTLETPAFVIGDYLIWGLTYRILSALFLEDG